METLHSPLHSERRILHRSRETGEEWRRFNNSNNNRDTPFSNIRQVQLTFKMKLPKSLFTSQTYLSVTSTHRVVGLQHHVKLVRDPVSSHRYTLLVNRPTCSVNNNVGLLTHNSVSSCQTAVVMELMVTLQGKTT